MSNTNSLGVLASFQTYHESRFGSVCAKFVLTGDAAEQRQQICTACYTKWYALQVIASCVMSVSDCALIYACVAEALTMAGKLEVVTG